MGITGYIGFLYTLGTYSSELLVIVSLVSPHLIFFFLKYNFITTNSCNNKNIDDIKPRYNIWKMY